MDINWFALILLSLIPVTMLVMIIKLICKKK